MAEASFYSILTIYECGNWFSFVPNQSKVSSLYTFSIATSYLSIFSSLL